MNSHHNNDNGRRTGYKKEREREREANINKVIWSPFSIEKCHHFRSDHFLCVPAAFDLASKCHCIVRPIAHTMMWHENAFFMDGIAFDFENDIMLILVNKSHTMDRSFSSRSSSLFLAVFKLNVICIDEYLFINVERLKCHTMEIPLWKINSYEMFHWMWNWTESSLTTTTTHTLSKVSVDRLNSWHSCVSIQIGSHGLEESPSNDDASIDSKKVRFSYQPKRSAKRSKFDWNDAIHHAMQPTAMPNKFGSNEKIFIFFKIIVPFVRVEMDMEIYEPLASFRYICVYK